MTTRDELRTRQRERLCRAVIQALQGNYDDHCFTQFDLELRVAGMTLEELGVSEEQIAAFARGYTLQNARQALQDGEALRVKSYVDNQGVTPTELGITPGELDALCHQEGLRQAAEALEKCRRGEFEPHGSGEIILNGLVWVMEDYGLTPTDIGATQQEIESFMRPEAIALAEYLVNEVHQTKGDYYSWQIPVWTLWGLVKEYDLKPDEIDVPREQLEHLAAKTVREFMASWAHFAQNNEGRWNGLDALTRWVNISEIGITDEDLRRLRETERLLLDWAGRHDIV